MGVKRRKAKETEEWWQKEESKETVERERGRGDDWEMRN